MTNTLSAGNLHSFSTMQLETAAKMAHGRVQHARTHLAAVRGFNLMSAVSDEAARRGLTLSRSDLGDYYAE